MVDDLMQVCEKYLVLVANPATFPPWFVNETPPSFELTAIGLATPLTLQVKIECGKGRLEQGQSPVFYPNDPTKASARSTLGPMLFRACTSMLRTATSRRPAYLDTPLARSAGGRQSRKNK